MSSYGRKKEPRGCLRHVQVYKVYFCVRVDLMGVGNATRNFDKHHPTSTMSLTLPIATNIQINYDTEKGLVLYLTLLLRLFRAILDKIRDFLSKFKGSLEKDLAQDFANIDIRTNDRDRQDDFAPLKYMQQLVRVVSRSQ